MNIFYTPQVSLGKYLLTETESRHCVKVLRKKNGDELQLTDGAGKEYLAVITDAHPKKCELEVISFKEYENPYAGISIAIAPTKNIDRLEWFLEKATEIGVGAVYPFISNNSERKVLKPERLEKVLVSAMKQSLKKYKPVLHPLQSFAELADVTKNIPERFIAYCGNEYAKTSFQTVCNNRDKKLIMIGPEGDFTDEEVRYVIEKGFVTVSLGDTRLRTETAGVVACTMMNFI